MKLNEHADVVRFLKTVNECPGEVTFCTEDGDCLNLKSALSQYVFVMLFSKPELLRSGEIRCGEAAAERLREFMIQ